MFSFLRFAVVMVSLGRNRTPRQRAKIWKRACSKEEAAEAMWYILHLVEKAKMVLNNWMSCEVEETSRRPKTIYLGFSQSRSHGCLSEFLEPLFLKVLKFVAFVTGARKGCEEGPTRLRIWKMNCQLKEWGKKMLISLIPFFSQVD